MTFAVTVTGLRADGSSPTTIPSVPWTIVGERLYVLVQHVRVDNAEIKQKDISSLHPTGDRDTWRVVHVVVSLRTS